MTYGLKVKNSSGNQLLITPDIMTLYESDRTAMPTSASSGSTYEKTINLPTGLSVDEANIGAIATSFIVNVDITVFNLDYYGFNNQSWFLDNSFDFFTRNENTGVVTTFTPDKTSETTYDGLLSIFPLSFWDKRGLTTFNNVNFFAGTCYLAYDQSATGYVTVYSVGSEGVENIDYAIYLSHYNE